MIFIWGVKAVSVFLLSDILPTLLLQYMLCFVCVCVSVVVVEEADVLEEDVFHEEAVTCLLSPLHPESLDFPDTPVSL